MEIALPTWAPPGSVYKTTKGIAVNVVSEPVVDRSLMSAAPIICTKEIDRDNEVIFPGGVNLANYQSNPVVLWDHGFSPEFPTPIAKCEHPDGRLAIEEQTDERMVARSYFTDKDMRSYQIFGLIDEGLIRAASIHVLPDYDQARQVVIDGKKITSFPVSEMLEWSWGCMGVNPEAVAKVLDRRTLGNERICDSIIKTLSPFYPAKKTLVRGWTPPAKDTVMAKKKFELSAIKTMSTDELQKSMPEADDDSKKAMEEEVATREDVAETETEVDEDLTPSAKVLTGVHSALVGIVSAINAAANQYENPTVKEHLTALIETINAEAAAIEGLYGEASNGKSMKPADSADEPKEDDLAKSWLAASSRRGLELGGFASRLDTLARAKNLRPDQQQTVTGVVKHFRKLIGAAKTMKPAEPKPNPEDERLKKLETTFEGIGNKLKELAPAK